MTTSDRVGPTMKALKSVLIPLGFTLKGSTFTKVLSEDLIATILYRSLRPMEPGGAYRWCVGIYSHSYAKHLHNYVGPYDPAFGTFEIELPYVAQEGVFKLFSVAKTEDADNMAVEVVTLVRNHGIPLIESLRTPSDLVEVLRNHPGYMRSRRMVVIEILDKFEVAIKNTKSPIGEQ